MQHALASIHPRHIFGHKVGAYCWKIPTTTAAATGKNKFIWVAKWHTFCISRVRSTLSYYASFVCYAALCSGASEPSHTLRVGLENFTTPKMMVFLVHTQHPNCLGRTRACCAGRTKTTHHTRTMSTPTIRYEYVSLFHFRRINYCLKVNYVCVRRCSRLSAFLLRILTGVIRELLSMYYCCRLLLLLFSCARWAMCTMCACMCIFIFFYFSSFLDFRQSLYVCVSVRGESNFGCANVCVVELQHHTRSPAQLCACVCAQI